MSAASPAPDAPRPIGDGINWMQVALPAATLAIGVGIWDLVVRIGKLPPYVLPSPERVAAFQQIVRRAIPCFVRKPRGLDIYAACGQLKRSAG